MARSFISSASPRGEPREGQLAHALPCEVKERIRDGGGDGGTPGSPTPVGAAPVGTMCTSTAGISLMRRGR